ncbi:Lrp/AsnC family transcriptional regulator [uncultured Litoreibacter sp.]|uniref:Lrp/AsnC family transcriptional regulator n=1 Tax=uncultured Litoreibacter sp. TaxID=1392394 RepID=UPI0026071E54|nr:Lrp/AsnC family transcriptional regulator [uncultured Litoreibacter sp.]
MNKETEDIQHMTAAKRPLDPFDRKILAALNNDGRATYADIGDQVGLSAPAVHERVKRLRKSAIRGIGAHLDGPACGKNFLAFVHVDADSWGKSERMMGLCTFPEIEEMHSVAGDTCVIMKVRTENAYALEKFLAQLYVLPGVKGTKSYVVLSTYLERGVQPELTSEWPHTPLSGT